MKSNKVVDALFGVAIGDALGVPFEFKSSLEMQLNPAKDMIGFGTHNQQAGTWSDDSSLTFCLAESLTNGYNLVDIAKKIIAWKDQAYWTARGNIFDIGRTTSRAIENLREIVEDQDFEELKTLKKYPHEKNNGNGSLMRILPLVFHIKGLPIQKQFEIIEDVSSLTHAHIRVSMCCLIYLRLAEKLLHGIEKRIAYQETRKEVLAFWKIINFHTNEQPHFIRFIQNDITHTARTDLKSGGYVIEAIEASLWCFLKETSFETTVLSVINLGHDTDTTGAISGGLAGIYYSTKQIPPYWIASLARMEDIVNLGNRLHQYYAKH